MDNAERSEFLKQKPNYACHFRENWHTVGCSHRDWTKEQLQEALDNSKRAHELQLHLLNTEGKTDYGK